MSDFRNKLNDYVELTRLNKPIGIYLLLWPCLWAVWIASGGWPDLKILMIFTLGVVLMRSAGCVINDIADRKIDPHVSRTANRPIASGRVSVKEAAILFIVLCLVSFLLVLMTNTLTIKLSVIAVLLAASYPFMKRVTSLPQFYLGLAFGWAIPMAFAAIQNQVPLVAWLLLLAALLWAVVYDTIYAMVDREEDLKIGVKSTAILFGEFDVRIISIMQVLMLVCLIFAGKEVGLSWPFHISLLVVAVLMLFHRMLISPREPEQCFYAFKHNHWIGVVVLLGIIADQLIRG